MTGAKPDPDRVEAVLRALWGATFDRPGDAVAADVPFLSAGGHSLAAARLIARVQAELGVELPLAMLLRDDPTLHEFTVEVARRIGAAGAAVPGPAPAPAPTAGLAAERRAPVGPILRRIWVWHRLNPHSPAYNVVRVIEIGGPLQPAALRAALGDLASRHEALRGCVQEPTPGVPEVVVGAPVPVPLSVEVARAGAEERLHELVEAALRRVTERPLPMGRPPLWRVGLVHAPAARRSWLVLVLHHLIGDLRSSDLLLDELAFAYDSRRRSTEPRFAAPAPSLVESLQRELAQEGSPRWRDDLDWWRQQLGEAVAAPTLPLSGIPPADGAARADAGCASGDPVELSYHGVASTIELTATESAAVAAAARAGRLTPAAFFLTASAAVLSAWTGACTPEVLGLPSVRPGTPAEEGLVGFRLDTLPVRVAVPTDLPFGELGDLIRAAFLDAAEHSQPPFDEVLRVANVPRLGTRSPLIRLWFNDLTQARCPESIGGAPAVEYDLPPGGALFDLNLYLRTAPGGRYRLHLVKPVGTMEPADAAAWLRQVGQLAVRAAADPVRPVRELLQSPAEEPSPPPPRPFVTTTDALLSRRAAERPDDPALSDLAGVLAYRALDGAVGKLAESVAAIVPAGDRVAVPARRDREFVVRLLACWRAGLVPVPLEAAWPSRRRSAALAAAGVAWAFTAAGRLPEPVPTPDRPRPDPIGTDPSATDRPIGHVLFTSGTSGLPLPVAVPAGAAEHELDALRDRFGIGPCDRVSFLSGAAHDVALRDTVLPLRAGATVHVPPPEVVADPAAVSAWLAAERITVVNATPVLLGLVLELAGTSLPDLRLVVSGGAPLSPTVLQLVQRRAPGATIVNGYGCTETPQLVTAEVMPPGYRPPPGGVPIGVPLGRRRVELRSAGLRPDVGQPGEVWVAEPEIAAGYLGPGRPDGFTVDPAGRRWFRTGDLARRDSAGRLHLAGRSDRQILVNGHRLSLDEVELVTRSLSGVAEAVAAPADDADGRTLRLWVRPAAGATPTGEDIRLQLQQRLPAVAVPTRVVVVDRLPTTENLKAAVPAAEPAAVAAAPLDERIRRAAETIAGGPVDPDTSFFAAGFSSVSLLQLSSELAEVTGRPVSPIAPFRYPTLRMLSGYLGSGPTGRPDDPAIGPGARSGPDRGPRTRRGDQRPPDAMRVARRAARAGLRDRPGPDADRSTRQ